MNKAINKLYTHSVDGAEIRYVGRVYGGDLLESLCGLLSKGVLRARVEIVKEALELSGNFTCVIEDRNGRVFAFIDKIRSYPLFYAKYNGTIRVGLTPEEVSYDALQTLPIHGDALREFAMTGYVTGSETLRDGIMQLRAGEFLDAINGDVIVGSYYKFYSDTDTQSHDVFREELYKTTEDIFRKLIKRLDGRPAFVPLSMGLDSRLILTMLHSLGYDRIETFSYGRKGNCEAAAAESIAHTLGVPWRMVPYDRDTGKAFYESECQNYMKYAHRSVSTPSMLDIHAVRALVEKGIAPDDAVFINGQTGDFISGGHIPRLCDQDLVTQDELLGALAKRHYSLWKPLLDSDGIAFVGKRIRQALGPLPERMTGTEAMKLYELWEWRARQSTYVVQGQRSYEFYGRDWELPLWDDAYLNFWSRIPLAEKRNQFLYKSFLSHWDYKGLFRDVSFPEYLSPASLRTVSKAFIVFGESRVEFRRRYLHYWQEYAHQYSVVSFGEYVKLANQHRNPVSFFSRQILKDWYEIDAMSLERSKVV
jgi:asparagine synthase (glutamine-hydrolysing)